MYFVYKHVQNKIALLCVLLRPALLVTSPSAQTDCRQLMSDARLVGTRFAS